MDSGRVCAYFLTRCRNISMVLLAWSRTIFSLSISDGQRPGRIFVAQSSSEYTSTVAESANNAAFLAWTNGSLNALAKAAVRTFARDYYNDKLMDREERCDNIRLC